MLPLRGILALLAAVSISAGCGRKAAQRVPPQTGPVRLVLQLDDVPRAELGGYYQALAKGYYRQAGLAVEIVAGTPDSDALGAVAEARADFGLGRSDDVLVRAALGLPLKMVAAMRQHDALVLLVHQSSPVKTAADLGGRTVCARSGQAWSAFLQKRNRVTFTLKPPLDPAAFIATPEAIQTGYLTSDLEAARRRGGRVRAMPLSDARYDPYHVLVCRQEFARNNGEQVRAFVSATLAGWADFLENDPEPAFALIRQRNPALASELLEYARGELILGKYVAGEADRGEAMGDLSFDRIRGEMDLLLDLGVMGAPVSIAAVASKEYVPAAGP